MKMVACDNVEGNFMDLVDFPHLKVLEFVNIPVTGDVREISESDFSQLDNLLLPSTVYGSHFYKIQHISEAKDMIAAILNLKRG